MHINACGSHRQSHGRCHMSPIDCDHRKTWFYCVIQIVITEWNAQFSKECLMLSFDTSSVIIFSNALLQRAICSPSIFSSIEITSWLVHRLCKDGANWRKGSNFICVVQESHLHYSLSLKTYRVVIDHIFNFGEKRLERHNSTRKCHRSRVLFLLSYGAVQSTRWQN